MTKETILKYAGFVDNQFLDQYLKLINSADTITEYRYAHHHVIPVCWYKLNSGGRRRQDSKPLADLDQTQEIVLLDFKHHLKAHQLLMLCTEGELQTDLVFAYNCMLTGEHWQTKYPSSSKKEKSKKVKVKKVYVNNGKVNKKVLETELQQYLQEGWVKGFMHKGQRRKANRQKHREIKAIQQVLYNQDRSQDWTSLYEKAKAIYESEH